MGYQASRQNECTMSTYLADTTILIDHLRGNASAKQFLKEYQPYISSITVAELIQGAKNTLALKRAKKLWQNLEIIYIDEETNTKALILLEQYYLSHGLKILDAFIATTAISQNLSLITSNIKHFSFIKGLQLRPWKEFE